MGKNAKATIRIKGMFCPHCEERIVSALKGISGVESAEASFRRGEATVIFDPESTSISKLCEVVVSEGYSTEEKGAYIQIVSVLIILLSLYIIARRLGWINVFNQFPSIESTMELGMLFLIGLMTSIHCIAMCGGINLTQAAASSEGSGKVAVSNTLYNTGRIISYTLTGAVCGAISQTVGLSGTLRGILPIIIGGLMLVMTLNMLGVFKLTRIINLRLPQGLYLWAAGRARSRSSFIVGLLNGLMPCGPLQSMQIYALGTGSAFKGALSMLMFSLGTVPLMFGFGFLAGKLNQKYRKYMLSVSAVIIFIMGIHMLTDGLALSGISLIPQKSSYSEMAVVKDGTQYIRSEIDYGSYPAITVRQGIPVDWTIVVPVGKLNGCNGEILVPAYDIDLKLHEGENHLTFVPHTVENVPYSCWMGMIKSSITVMD
ncbi:MAG: sulfite exporter TauE/SafE family protein [Lachnospiraceae bacterium]|nr:sulfite exporter TauE/SafE family protein [Lachnospiraceae bacterium]